jgi:hypothetical protein
MYKIKQMQNLYIIYGNYYNKALPLLARIYTRDNSKAGSIYIEKIWFNYHGDSSARSCWNMLYYVYLENNRFNRFILFII